VFVISGSKEEVPWRCWSSGSYVHCWGTRREEDQHGSSGYRWLTCCQWCRCYSLWHYPKAHVSTHQIVLKVENGTKNIPLCRQRVPVQQRDGLIMTVYI